MFKNVISLVLFSYKNQLKYHGCPFPDAELRRLWLQFSTRWQHPKPFTGFTFVQWEEVMMNFPMRMLYTVAVPYMLCCTI